MFVFIDYLFWSKMGTVSPHIAFVGVMQTLNSAKQRWQPPPMRQAATARVVVDEAVVGQVLQINPSLARGRTVREVKEALERGEGLTGDSQSVVGASPVVSLNAADSFNRSFEFFIAGKAAAAQNALRVIADQRAALDAQEKQLKKDLAGEIQSFLGLLDKQLVATCAEKILGRYAEFLKLLGHTAQSVLPVHLLRR